VRRCFVWSSLQQQFLCIGYTSSFGETDGSAILSRRDASLARTLGQGSYLLQFQCLCGLPGGVEVIYSGDTFTTVVGLLKGPPPFVNARINYPKYRARPEVDVYYIINTGYDGYLPQYPLYIEQI
jgi:hypothetical protein